MQPDLNESDGGDAINPYIALSDLTISLLIIVALFVALGRIISAFNDDNQYKHTMQEFADAVDHDIALGDRPFWEKGRNDPPGVQRWVFSGRTLFASAGGPDSKPSLSKDGERVLSTFDTLLVKRSQSWRRIRVEGHTRPHMPNRPDDWELSSRRAAIVVNFMTQQIKPWFFAVSCRAGQNPLHSLIVFARDNDPVGQHVKTRLQNAGVSYTTRDLSSRDLANDASVQRYLPQIGKSGAPYIVEFNSDNTYSVFPASDEGQLRAVMARFPDNERVEVLIEYTKQGTNNIQ